MYILHCKPNQRRSEVCPSWIKTSFVAQQQQNSSWRNPVLVKLKKAEWLKWRKGGICAVTVWCPTAWAASRPRPERCAWPGRADGCPAHVSFSAASWKPRRKNLLSSDWWASLTLAEKRGLSECWKTRECRAETLLMDEATCVNVNVCFLTDSLHHAGLSGVRLHWNDVLEAVQWDDALVRLPHLKDVLHFGAQFLPHRQKRKKRSSSYWMFHLVGRADQRHPANLGGFVPSVVL